jgi:3',5'-cyclic AMP phosphodiesterase CpdA
MSLRFVHVSDIHLLDLSGTRPWDFFNKRITGAVNLVLKRAKQHDEHIFDAAVAFAHTLGAERLVITGDLTNLALPSEFEHVRERLEAAGLPVTVIPGNHDAYTRAAVRDGLFERYLSTFMEGERDGAPYPFVQKYDDVVLIGVSTGVVSLPLFATGVVGTAQLARLEHALEHAAAEKLARIVLIHHPPVAGVSKPRHDLLDLAAFGEVISRHGAELILHGHEHRRIDTTLPGPAGDVPVHGIGSGTSRSQRPGREASLSLYEADRERIHRELYTWNGSSFARAA